MQDVNNLNQQSSLHLSLGSPRLFFCNPSLPNLPLQTQSHLLRKSDLLPQEHRFLALNQISLLLHQTLCSHIEPSSLNIKPLSLTSPQIPETSAKELRPGC